MENRLTPVGKRPRLSSSGGLAVTVSTPHLKTPKVTGGSAFDRRLDRGVFVGFKCAFDRVVLGHSVSPHPHFFQMCARHRPQHVLQDMLESRDVTEEMAARALCSCVVSAAQEDGQDEALVRVRCVVLVLIGYFWLMGLFVGREFRRSAWRICWSKAWTRISPRSK